MKEFWNENKKIIRKLILNQFIAAFFGLTLVLSASAADSIKDKLEMLMSIIAVLFFMFLIYNILWEKGGEDRIRIDGGRQRYSVLKGLWISLIANIPNFIIASVIIIAKPFAETQSWAGTMYLVGRTASLIWEAMYAGLIGYFAPFNPIAHLLIIFPSLLTCTLAYYFGVNNKRLFGFLASRKKEAK